MNKFNTQNGRLRKWEVSYISKELNREALMRFVDEAAAKEFAFKVNGVVKEIENNPFILQPVR